MGNSLLAVRGINHKYIVVGGLFYGLLDMANGHVFRGLGKIIGIVK